MTGGDDVMRIIVRPQSPSPEPSPYVSIYMARTQAEKVAHVLRWAVDGRGKSNPLRRALKVIEDALGNGGDDVNA
jgi:hypothetical protein